MTKKTEFQYPYMKKNSSQSFTSNAAASLVVTFNDEAKK